MYMDDITVFAKNKKELETLNTNNKNLQSGYTNGIWHRMICYAHNEKW